MVMNKLSEFESLLFWGFILHFYPEDFQIHKPENVVLIFVAFSYA